MASPADTSGQADPALASPAGTFGWVHPASAFPVDTYDQFEKEDSNLTFLSIVAGLAESIVRGIPEKDVKYYAMIAVIYDTIQIYQS